MNRIHAILSAPVGACACLFCALGAVAAPPPEGEFAPAAGEEAESFPVPAVTFRLEAAGGGLLLMDEEMQDDYGGIPLGELGLALEYDERTQYCFGLGYGHRSVSMDLDDPTFETTETLELELIPIRFALRTNTSPLRSFRMNVGLFIEVIHMKETAPYFSFYPTFESGRSADSGWGSRFGLSLGPEWRFADDAGGLGFDLQLATGGGEVGGDSGQEISLEGFGARVFCSWKLGTVTDEPKSREVAR